MKRLLLPWVAIVIAGALAWANAIELAIDASDEKMTREIRADIEQPISWDLKCGGYDQNGLQMCAPFRRGFQPIVGWDVETWLKRVSDKAVHPTK